MDKEALDPWPAREAPTHLSLKDVMIALVAIGAVVLVNCEVVRALDLALDVLHR